VPLALSITADSVAEPVADIVTVRPPVVRLLPLASLACIVIVEALVPSVPTITVSATFGGSNVGDTADVNFIASEVSDSPGGVATRAHSTLTANPSGVVADGTSTSTITMQAKDANGNNLTTGGLKITMSASCSATLSAVRDIAACPYTGTIAISTVETVTVTAAFGGSNDIVTVRPPVVRLLPLASLACMVIVEMLVPSATTLLGLAVRQAV
jgi:hypothetical protein